MIALYCTICEGRVAAVSSSKTAATSVCTKPHFSIADAELEAASRWSFVSWLSKSFLCSSLLGNSVSNSFLRSTFFVKESIISLIRRIEFCVLWMTSLSTDGLESPLSSFFLENSFNERLSAFFSHSLFWVVALCSLAAASNLISSKWVARALRFVSALTNSSSNRFLSLSACLAAFPFSFSLAISWEFRSISSSEAGLLTIWGSVWTCLSESIPTNSWLSAVYSSLPLRRVSKVVSTRSTRFCTLTSWAA